MKYFGVIDKNVTIFQLQWKIGNFSDMFLQYSELCGLLGSIENYQYKFLDSFLEIILVTFITKVSNLDNHVINF